MWIRDVHIAATLSYRDLEDFFTVYMYFFDKFFLENCNRSIKKTFDPYSFFERPTG